MAYDAFISYSHAADGRLAPAVQAALQRLAKPWYRRRALRVFRDDTGLSVNPHLWGSIEAALDGSEWFLLLTSPAAAQSEWVNREIEHWKATKPLDHILPVVTDGTWEWDRGQRDFTANADAVPPALRGVFEDEPRHLDLRWARDETHLDLRHGAFRDAMAQLAAPLHGTTKDELEGEDIRMHRRALRLAWGAVAALALLLVASVVGAALAVSNSNRAEDKQREAQSRALAAQSRALPDENLDAALLLAVEAADRERSPETLGALAAALRRQPRLLRILQPPGGTDVATAAAVAMSRDGASAVSLSEHPFTPGAGPQPSDVALIDWQVASGEAHASEIPGTGAVALAPSGDGLVARTDGSVAYIDAAGDATSVIDSAFPGLDVSADGERAIVYPRTGVAELWDVPGDERLWRGDGTAAFDIDLFSPDGSRAAVLRPDGSLLVIDARTGDERGVIRIPEQVSIFAFSRSGDTIVTGSTNGMLSVWRDDGATGQVLATGNSSYYRLAVSPDGGTALVAMTGQRTVAVDTADGSIRWEGPVFEYVAFSPDGTRVLVTTLDTADLRVVDTGTVLITEASRGIGGIALTRDGTRAATAGSLFNVWDFADGEAVISEPDNATQAEWNRAEDTIVTYGGAGAAVWNPRDPRPEPEPLATPGSVLSVAFDGDGRYLATGTEDTGAVWVWDLGPLVGLGSLRNEPASLGTSVAAFDAASDTVAYQNGDDSPVVVETGDGPVELDYERDAFDVLVAPGGKRLVTRSFGRKETVSALYDLESGDVITDELPCGSGVETSAVEATDVGTDRIVSVTAEGVAACDAVTGELIAQHDLPASLEAVGAAGAVVRLDPTGEQVAVADGTGHVAILDIESSEVVAELDAGRGESVAVNALAFSPDGETLGVGVSGPGVFGLWDWRDGSDAVDWLTAHRELVYALGFSPDGDRLAVGAASDVGVSNGDVQLWDLDRRRPIGEPLTAPFGGVLIDRVEFSPGGGRLYARDTSGTVVEWTVDEAAWRQLACAKAGRNLTAGEWDRYVVGEDYRSTCDQWPPGA